MAGGRLPWWLYKIFVTIADAVLVIGSEDLVVDVVVDVVLEVVMTAAADGSIVCKK